MLHIRWLKSNYVGPNIFSQSKNFIYSLLDNTIGKFVSVIFAKTLNENQCLEETFLMT